MASLASKLSNANENTWILLGKLTISHCCGEVNMICVQNYNILNSLFKGGISELMHDPDKAMYSYENALRHHPYNIKALTQIASICRLREQYAKVCFPLQNFEIIS
jgi:hypothetical protein